MIKKENKLIDLKGANSTMKLGLVLYSVMVVAFILCACVAYAAGDPISNRTHTARPGHHAGRTFTEVP